MQFIDFRSDTVTRPTPAMRDAIAHAEVGDDVLGDDPTVQRLEETVASLLGKPSAVFVPSGTMANQIALGLAGRPGTEVLLHEGAHIYRYEAGAPAALWGMQLVPVRGDKGRFTVQDIENSVRPPNVHFAPLCVVTMENTHNRAGGCVWPLEDLKRVSEHARSHGLHVHLDGARLWNAVATGAGSLIEFADTADTVSVCFSKGLGAPVGSALAGSHDHIQRARFLRKRLGGGMRQAGILASAALYALDHHRDRLIQDHDHARQLARFLTTIPGLTVLPQETNIVIVDLGDRGQENVVARLQELGVGVSGFGPSRFRMVTHLDIDQDRVDRGIEALKQVFL